MLQILDTIDSNKVSSQIISHISVVHGFFLFLDVTCVFGSHEADDSPGECSSKPEHQHGQHAAPVRGREE